MSACSSVLVVGGSREMPDGCFNASKSSIVRSSRSDIRFLCKGAEFCWRTSGILNRRGKQREIANLSYSHLGPDAAWSWGKGRVAREGEPAVAGELFAANSVHSDGSVQEAAVGAVVDGMVESSSTSSENSLGGESLKLQSGSCYLPHPDKEETGGEDAHFICVNEQVIGVADGVGGWAEVGINAGLYARELMTNSISAVREEPEGSADPARVLEKAFARTKAKGSSTACIVALTDQGIHAVNLGDSGFMIVREGSIILRSPVQQHDFNFTYQLQCGMGSDLPSAADVFNFPVKSGDIIVAGTDGLFDNLYPDEIAEVVAHAAKAGLSPQMTARKIAALAKERALDGNLQSPFSAAAQDFGYNYDGGKLDDITVVVSYVSSSLNS